MSLNKCIALLLMLIPIASFSQTDDKEFKQILSLQKVGKTFRFGTPIDTAWYTYLGIITDSSSHVKYYIIKEFSKLQAGDTWHGHSRIYFFDGHKKLKATYDAGMPEDLPFKLVNNTFYFHFIEKGVTKIHKETIIFPLGKQLFCTGSNCDVIYKN